MRQIVTIPEIGFQSSLQGFLSFFDHYTDTRAFIKDKACRYVYANKAYADLLQTEPVAMIGKSDYDFYEPNIADLYQEEDRKTLAGDQFVNQRWMVPDANGVISWCISNKYPLRDEAGAICGIFCTFRDQMMAGTEAKPFFDLAEVVEHIHRYYEEDIRAEDLAELLSVSVSQLNRRFRSTMGKSPISYLLHVRINAAKEKLIKTDQSVTEIGLACGFNSPAYFSRQFKVIAGMTPKQFRARYT